jgi:hypothetical protein
MLRPEDIDFPVSDTFAGGLAALHGWEIPVRCESLQEARDREWHEAYTRKPATQGQAIRNLTEAVKDIRQENRELRELIFRKKGGGVVYE